MKRTSTIGLAGLLVFGLLASLAQAQGLLVVADQRHPSPLPRPLAPAAESSYRIKELAVQARLVDQVARVQVAQSFVNTGSRQMEVAFVFPLPYDGAIDQLTLMVDGKEYPAKLLPADEARRIYEGYIRRNQDPALLQWMGTGMFQTSVFPVPPGAERKVTLRYNQLLRKNGTLTDFLFPLSTARYTSAPVEKVDIQVSIESGIELTSVYSPTHTVEVERPGAHQAKIRYLRENEVPASDFRMFFDVAAGKVGASVISYRPETDEDGYFLLLASPRAQVTNDQRPAKNIVCVFDRSGSMQGEKFEQARAALKYVINNLDAEDRFNIVAYDTEVEAFQPELLPVTDENRRKALGFVENLYAGGGTNIDGALSTVLGMLDQRAVPNYVIFMTDGQPTIGETNESKIVAATEQHNKVRARVVSLGVGYDVNSRLLDRLSLVNFGQSQYVRPNEDIESHVSRLYNRISAPVMTDVAVNFEFDSLRVEQGDPIVRVYPKQVTDLFEGEQLVLVGRYKKTGPAKVVIRGRVGSDEHRFDFATQLVEGSGDDTYGFVEKLWAMRRIGELIDQLDLHGPNEELTKELETALSTKHGILTPYTSFLADDQAGVHDLTDARRGGRMSLEKSGEALERLREADGQAAFAQRALKAQFKNAAKAPAEIQAGPQPVAGAAVVFNIDEDQAQATENVRQVENRALYKRGNRLFTSDVAKLNLEDLKDKIQVIDRYSKEYFELVKKASSSNNKALSRQRGDEELLLEVNGSVMLVK